MRHSTMRKVGMGIGRTKAHRTFLKLRSSAAAGLHTMPSRYPSQHSGSRPTDLGWNRDICANVPTKS